MQQTAKIKTECGTSFCKTVCYACLSSDRKLNVLGQLDIIFRQICFRNIDCDMSSEIFLCWECRSVLVKFKHFQEQVVKARSILNSCVDDHCPPKSLSKLSATEPTITNFNETEKDTENENKYEITVEDDDQETKYIEAIAVKKNEPNPVIKEEPDLNYNDDFDSFDYVPLAEIKDENLANTFLKELKDIKVEKVKVKISKKPKEQSKRTKRYKMTYQKLDNAVKKIAIDKKELEDWLERERNSKYYKSLKNKCEKCISGIGKDSQEEHNKKYHLKSKTMAYSCNICHQYFPSEENTAIHMEQHYFYRHCGICGYKCYNKQSMKNHLMVHSRVVQCLECEATFTNTREFFVHYKSAHTIFICDYCNKKFKAKSTLEGHIHRYHTIHRCEECNITFASYRCHKEHYKLKHRIERTEASYCVQCNIQFDTILLFRRHINDSVAHSAERSWQRKKITVQCPACPNVYMRKTSMMNHYRKVHAKQSKYYCSPCEKQFLNRTRYKDHMMYLHEGQKKKRNKICYICGRGFYDNRILTNHVRTHTGERPFACTHCDARFAQKAALTSHIKFIHMKTKRKPDLILGS